MKKILVIGKNGQVGFDLMHTLQGYGEVIGTDRNTLDLSRPETIFPFIDLIKPSIIVNAAAYTNVDKAESESELAFTINAKASLEMAKAAKKHNSLFIYFSTDYVFNGKKSGAYEETDLPDPINIYGKSKLLGEQAVENVGGRYFIFRTSWVYSNRGKNFPSTMLKLAKERAELRVVNDQFGAPTCSLDIARAISSILDHEAYGLYNLTAGGRTSWYEFAQEILKDTQVKLIPIPSSEYPTPAKRPANSVLSHKKLNDTLNIFMPNWKDSIKAKVHPK